MMLQHHFFSRKNRHKPTRLRKSIKPGTILIVLAGRFRGKRVIFLKQLQPSGLLLVTGPYKVNGVPLRRMNQAYVIATSTRIDVSKIDVSKINDEWFKQTNTKKSAQKAAKEKAKKEGQDFLQEPEKKKEMNPARVAEQKRVDALLLPILQKTDYLKAYMNAKFSLTKGVYPHAIKF